MKKLITIILTMLISASMLLMGCNPNEVLIYAPDGAPALALVSVIDQDFKNTKINIVSADKIKSVVTGDDKKADICILPINMASTLIGSGDDYKMLGTITHGNFYFMSSSNIAVDSNNISVLLGKTIGVMQLQNVPGLTLRSVLKDNGLDYEIIEDTKDAYSNKVNLIAINKVETARTDIDLFLIPSPQADAKEQNTSLKFVGSLSELYGEFGFPQAIVVVKNSMFKRDLNLVKRVVYELEYASEFLLEESPSTIWSLVKDKIESGLTPQFNVTNITSESIERSNIKFVDAKTAKDEVVTFIEKLKEIEPNSVKEFNENFFYLGDL